jgi:transposase
VRKTRPVELIEVYDDQVDRFTSVIRTRLAGDRGYKAIQTIPSVGPVLASVFTAEIGDIHRFPAPSQLCSWAGLTPRHRESDTVIHRGHITKQGSRLVRSVRRGSGATAAVRYQVAR